MTNALAASRYRRVLDDIGRLYERARRTVVETYWQIGRRLVEVEQVGALRAEYGAELVPRLSADLSARHGTGFSTPNLWRMRRFYLAYPILSALRELTWAHYTPIRVRLPGGGGAGH